MHTRWIDKFTDIEIDGPVVCVKALCDDAIVASRSKRHVYREYIERAIRQLDEADLRDRCEVLPFGVRTG